MGLIDLQIAARSLLQHSKRTGFLGAAIASVTILMVLLNGLIAGIDDMMLRSATTLMTGHVNVGGFFKVTSGAAAPLVTDFQKVMDDVKGEVAGVDYIVARGRGFAKAVSDTATQDLILGGIDIRTENGFRQVVQPLSGNLDDFAKPNTALIFETQAKKLGVKVGDSLTLSAPTARGTNNTADVRIIAICKDIGLLSVFNAYVTPGTLRSLYQLKDTATGALQIYLKDHSTAPLVAAHLREVLEKKGHRLMEPDPQPYFQKLMTKVNREDWTGQKLDVTTWMDEMSFISSTLKILRALSFLLTLILAVIIVVGIMNTMWIAIRERTREIGTLRAIGMQRGKVRTMFLLEAALLGFGSTVFGVTVASLIAIIVNAAHISVPESVQMFLMTDHLNLAIHPGGLASAIISLTLLVTFAALYPAWRAAKLQPVTAMHHIG